MLSSGPAHPGAGVRHRAGSLLPGALPPGLEVPPQGMELVTSWLREQREVPRAYGVGSRGVATNMSTDDTANWPLHQGVARLPTPTCVATSDCPGGNSRSLEQGIFLPFTGVLDGIGGQESAGSEATRPAAWEPGATLLCSVRNAH